MRKPGENEAIMTTAIVPVRDATDGVANLAVAESQISVISEFDKDIVKQAITRIMVRRKERQQKLDEEIAQYNEKKSLELTELEKEKESLLQEIKKTEEEQIAALDALTLAEAAQNNESECDQDTASYERENREALEKFIKDADSFPTFAVEYLKKNRRALVKKIRNAFVGAGKDHTNIDEIISFLMKDSVYPAVAPKVFFEAPFECCNEQGVNRTAAGIFVNETLHDFFTDLKGCLVGKDDRVIMDLDQKLNGKKRINLRNLIELLDYRVKPDTYANGSTVFSSLGGKYCSILDNIGDYIFRALKKREAWIVNDDDANEKGNTDISDDEGLNHVITEMMSLLSGIEPGYVSIDREKRDYRKDCKRHVKRTEKSLADLQDALEKNEARALEIKKESECHEWHVDESLPPLTLPNIKELYEKLRTQLKVFLIRRGIQLDIEKAMAEKDDRTPDPRIEYEQNTVSHLADCLLDSKQSGNFYEQRNECRKAPLKFPWYAYVAGNNQNKRQMLKKWESAVILDDVSYFYSMIFYIHSLFTVGKKYYELGGEQQKNGGELLTEIASIYAEKAGTVATEIEVKIEVPNFTIADLQKHLANLAMLMDGNNVQKVISDSAQMHQELMLQQQAQREVEGVLALSTPEGQGADFDRRLGAGK